MGSCVSTHQYKPSSASSDAIKVDTTTTTMVFHHFSNNDIKSPQLKPTSFRDFGSKEEKFFDSQAWLDSDCDDDFMSVNGEFTPSRGNTPVHHNFSAGNNKPLVSPLNQPSPTGTEKKMRLSDLFNDSRRGNYNSEFEQDGELAYKNGVNLTVASPFVDGGDATENGVHGLKTKRERFGRSVQNCFPTLISSRSSSTNGRKMISPGLSPRPNTVMG